MMNGLPFEQLLALVPGTIFVTVMFIIYSLLSIGVYIVTAYSLHTIAKRRFINRAWLAWIPVGNLWVLGSVADHYHLCAASRIKYRRRVLLFIAIAIIVLAVVIMVLCFNMVVELLKITDLGTGKLFGDWREAIGTTLIGLGLSYLAVLVLTIVQLVFMYIAYYDLFRSCDPKNAVIYLVLSIFFPVILPVFLFVCRHKEQGLILSRRKPAPPAAESWQ